MLPQSLHLCGSGVFLHLFFLGLGFRVDLGLFLLLRERTTYSESEEESAAPGSYSEPVSMFADERVGDPLSMFAGDSVGEDGCCALVGE